MLGTAIFVVVGLMLASVASLPSGVRVLTVQSGSMEPNIKKGSVVLISPSEHYSVGDVVTFGQISKSEMPITHRIKEVLTQNGKTLFITKGDNNPVQDMLAISQENIIGKVRIEVPYLGYAINFVRNPGGFVALVVIPGVVIAYDQGRKAREEYIKYKKKQTRQKLIKRQIYVKSI